MSLERRSRMLMLAAWLAFLAVPLLSAPAVACSCAMTEVAGLAEEPGAAVFSGQIAADDERGVPVIVDRWYLGTESAPVMWLSRQMLGGDDASCGTTRPATGTWWIFGTSGRLEDGTVPVSLCSLQGQIGMEVGNAIQADAVRAFGEGQPIVQPDTAAEDESALWLGAAGVAAVIGVLVIGAMVWRIRATDW